MTHFAGKIDAGGAAFDETRWVVVADKPADTERLGRLLAPLLPRGAVVLLDGDLGAGKTTFVRGMAAGLGMDEHVVSSPTFTLIHEYDGDVPLYHFDTYRLDDAEQFVDLGAEEYVGGDGISVIEWGSRVAPYLPANRLEIFIVAGQVGDDGREGAPGEKGVGEGLSSRRFSFVPRGEQARVAVAALRRAWEAGR